MTTARPKQERTPIPFDEALRRMLNAPPQPKTTKKMRKKKPGK